MPTTVNPPPVDEYARKTRLSLFASSLLDEPLIAIYSLFSVILQRDLHATVWQIAILTMLRPSLAIFSFYWGARLEKNKRTLRSSLIWSNLLERLPFLIFPFVNNCWVLIIAALIHTLFHRAGIPALMEILKLNIPERKRERFFSLYSCIGYSEGIVLGIILGKVLGWKPESWRMIFFICTLLGMGTVWIRLKLPIKNEHTLQDAPQVYTSISEKIFKPWEDCYKLLKQRHDFAHFQFGFMLCGMGLMIMMPSIPFYTTDLGISFASLLVSFSICKGIGYVIASPIWAKAMSRYSMYQLTTILCSFFSLFAIALIFASFNKNMIFVAYVIYGIAQAGSRMLWHLSGPIFSGEKSSSLYSTVNVLTVGIRGLIGPLIGAYILKEFGCISAFGCGMILSFFGAWYMIMCERNKTPIPRSLAN